MSERTPLDDMRDLVKQAKKHNSLKIGAMLVERYEKKVAEYPNEKRDRYYGLRVGDTVKCKYTPDPDALYKVVHLSALDNNGVYLQKGNQEPIKAVAEHCVIIKKVEDNG